MKKRYIVTVAVSVEQFATIDAEDPFQALDLAHRDYEQYQINIGAAKLQWSQESTYDPPAFSVEETLVDGDFDLDDEFDEGNIHDDE